MDAKAENILTLKRYLGLTEEKANELLSNSIKITTFDNKVARVFSSSLLEMLTKTFQRVQLDSDQSNFDVEVVIGAVKEFSPEAKKVYVNWESGVLEVSLLKPKEKSSDYLVAAAF